jgi:two-component system sensor histidine kinase YesM
MKLNTFGKGVLLVVCLLVPIIILYSYSNQVSVNVVRETVEDGNRNRLSFFKSQMEMMIDQLTKHSVAASRDYSIREYLDGRKTSDTRVQLQRQLRIVDMLNMQTSTSAWNNQLIFYLPDSKETISTDYSAHYEEKAISDPNRRQWTYLTAMTFGLKQKLFSRIQESDMSELYIEVRFTEDNLRNMLSLFKQGGQREPFLYHVGEEPIVSYYADRTLVSGMIEQLKRLDGSQSNGNMTLSLNEQKYVVNYIRSESLGWYLVDIVPLQSIFAPIVTSRNLFYASIVMLLVGSVIVSLLLYRNVQRPMRHLIQGVHRIRDGQFSARLKQQANNEFDYLFTNFNEMAEQIEVLVEKVYRETLRSKEATLKQLQSQINPHFLYNCLFYIKNMANLGEKEAVVDMALNLGEYYRYSTRLEQTTTTLKEEVRLLENYLTIQSLRLQRFHFEIDIPESMLDLEIPRLLIQPLVENAILHGVENSRDFGLILITGEQSDGINRIIVDDNGQGVPRNSWLSFKIRFLCLNAKDRVLGYGTFNSDWFTYMKGNRVCTSLGLL